MLASLCYLGQRLANNLQVDEYACTLSGSFSRNVIKCSRVEVGTRDRLGKYKCRDVSGGPNLYLANVSPATPPLWSLTVISRQGLVSNGSVPVKVQSSLWNQFRVQPPPYLSLRKHVQDGLARAWHHSLREGTKPRRLTITLQQIP